MFHLKSEISSAYNLFSGIYDSTIECTFDCNRFLFYPTHGLFFGTGMLHGLPDNLTIKIKGNAKIKEQVPCFLFYDTQSIYHLISDCEITVYASKYDTCTQLTYFKYHTTGYNVNVKGS